MNVGISATHTGDDPMAPNMNFGGRIVETFRLTRQKFEEFRNVQISPRTDWPATFSCNHFGEVWPPPGYGFTCPDDRMHVQGHYPLLDEIVGIVLAERPAGGRFFLNDEGVFIPDCVSEKQQIVEWG